MLPQIAGPAVACLLWHLGTLLGKLHNIAFTQAIERRRIVNVTPVLNSQRGIRAGVCQGGERQQKGS